MPHLFISLSGVDSQPHIDRTLPTIKQDLEGQGQRPRVPGCDGAGTAERSYPKSEVRGDGREEIPRARGQGQQPRRATLRLRQEVAPKARAVTGGSNPMPKARGEGQEKQPHFQGVVAAWVQEGLEEPSHAERQEGWLRGDTPHPR